MLRRLLFFIPAYNPGLQTTIFFRYIKNFSSFSSKYLIIVKVGILK